MTGPSKRSIERAVDALADDGDPGSSEPPAVVFEDGETGEWCDADGAPLDRDEYDPDAPLMIIVRETVVETGWEP